MYSLFSPRLALAACIITFGVAHAAGAQNITRVEPGAAVEIEAHGTCREVKNSNSAAIMVPHATAGEWVSGGQSFLERMPSNVNVTACTCSWSGTTPNMTVVRNTQGGVNFGLARGFFNGGDGIVVDRASGFGNDHRIIRYERNGSNWQQIGDVRGNLRENVYIGAVSEDGNRIAGVHEAGSSGGAIRGYLYVAEYNGSVYNRTFEWQEPSNRSTQGSAMGPVSGNSDLSIITYWDMDTTSFRIFERQSNGQYSVIFNQTLPFSQNSRITQKVSDDGHTIYVIGSNQRIIKIERSGSSYVQNTVQNVISIGNRIPERVSPDGRYSLNVGQNLEFNPGGFSGTVAQASIVDLSSNNQIFLSGRIESSSSGFGFIQTKLLTGEFISENEFILIHGTTEANYLLGYQTYRINPNGTTSLIGSGQIGFPLGAFSTDHVYVTSDISRDSSAISIFTPVRRINSTQLEAGVVVLSNFGC